MSVASVACPTACLCSSCGLRDQTPCYTSSWGAGQTFWSSPLLMPTHLERSQVAFVTICWWEKKVDICPIYNQYINQSWLTLMRLCHFQTCVVRAWDTSRPLLFCPAMNTAMWQHPITAQQISKLVEFGYVEIPCIAKKLVCGDKGRFTYKYKQKKYCAF